MVPGEGERVIASTTFVNGVTLTDEDWFNDLNRLHYTIFSDPADAAAVRTALGIREVLTANRTYFVRTDGSDSNTGLANTAGGAWLTLQKAANYIQQNIDLAGFVVTVQVGSGTYTSGVSMFSPFVGGSASQVAGVVFSGDTTTPSNVVISTTAATCFVASFGAKYAVQGFKITTASSGDGLYASACGQIVVTGKMDFGTIVTGNYCVRAGLNSCIVISGNHNITANMDIWLYADRGGRIEAISGTITLTGTPAFLASCVYARNTGLVYSASLTFSGAATGSRYTANLNGVVDSNGGGANYFPGNSVGTTGTGGQYA